MPSVALDSRAMRTWPLPALLCAALLASSSASSAPGVAAEARDWRATACSDSPGADVAVSGQPTVVSRVVTPVAELRGAEIRVDRLDFSGVTCELLYVRAAAGRNAGVRVRSNSLCVRSDVAVNGVLEDQQSESCSAQAGPFRLFDDSSDDEVPDDVGLVTLTTYRPFESEVLQAEPGMPPEMVGSTITATHVSTRWAMELGGETLVKQRFDSTRATDRAAREAYARQVARAQRAHSRRVDDIERSGRSEGWKQWRLAEAAAARAEAMAHARKTQRLALRGVRLVRHTVDAQYAGTVPATP